TTPEAHERPHVRALVEGLEQARKAIGVGYLRGPRQSQYLAARLLERDVREIRPGDLPCRDENAHSTIRRGEPLSVLDDVRLLWGRHEQHLVVHDLLAAQGREKVPSVRTCRGERDEHAHARIAATRG